MNCLIAELFSLIYATQPGLIENNFELNVTNDILSNEELSIKGEGTGLYDVYSTPLLSLK